MNEINMSRLNRFAEKMVEAKKTAVGYPCNQNFHLADFYHWFAVSGLSDVNMNNVGDPREASLYALNTHEFENEVINFFAPFYGFDHEEVWGIISTGGTDGNNHGIYFGVNYLRSQNDSPIVIYVSEEAHYSIKKIADLQNIEMRLVPANTNGEMDIAQFEEMLDVNRPALVVIAMGTTFKGGIDDQSAIDEVLKRKPPVAVYRHMDAALFGGFLPFSAYGSLVNRKVQWFDSIAVSGHKFFGFDEPLGIFITSRAVLGRQNPFQVSYLNASVPTISCSRSAVAPLKLWWQIHKTGVHGYRTQAELILRNAQYLKDGLDKINYPAWKNPISNTVYFKRPAQWVMEKWELAPSWDDRLGGDLAHDIVMRHEGTQRIDHFLRDMHTSQIS